MFQIVGIYNYLQTLCYNSHMTYARSTILDLAHQRGILRSRELDALGFSRTALSRLVESGAILRLSRGLYALPNREVGEHSTFAEVAIKHPGAVFCLLSALQLHGVTTQIPHQVWIAVDNKARAPKMEYPPLKVIRFSGDALVSGVEDMVVDGVVHISVTGLEKTIADCFKFRNKIGLDVAIEALQEAWRTKRITMDGLWKFARICRVSNVMRPYLESLI